MDRKAKSEKNLVTIIICQFFAVFVSFFARYFFAKFLGKKYLGLDGLFTNILSVLTLTELGIGEAIIFSLYKPLAENNEEKINMLMNFYKKVYSIIGIVILVLGLLLTPFLNYIIKEVPDVSHLNLIYILYVLNTAISYFFSYKKNLIIADQKKYITTIYRYSFYFVLNVIQVIYLFISKNYIIFLLIQVVSTFLENYFISKKADKMYPFLNKNKQVFLDKNSKSLIVKNTKAMLMHKVGGVLVNSTDNILLSSLVSLDSVGMYSNYYLITNSLNSLYGQFFNSVLASVGNLFATSDKNKEFDIFEKIYFLNYWIYFFSTICLVNLINPFIELWLGSEFLFDKYIVIIICLNFYFTGMRKTSLTFRNASGLFYTDRWKAPIEAIVNLLFSVILVFKFGIAGVFVGTLISTLTVSGWVEPYVLFKHGFNKKFIPFLKKYITQFVIMLVTCIITYLICNLFVANKLTIFIYKLIICLIVPNLILIIIYRKSHEYLYFKNYLFEKIKKIKRKKFI